MVNILRLVKSFSHAFRGLKHTLLYHQNLRVHVTAAIVIIALGLFFRIPAIEWAVVTAAIFFVLVAEMVNTTLEEIINLVREDHHERARVAKDVSAGMVLMAAIFAVLVGLIVFFPYLIK